MRYETGMAEDVVSTATAEETLMIVRGSKYRRGGKEYAATVANSTSR